MAVLASWRAGVAPRLAASCISIGYGLLGMGVLAGLLLQEDPDWFFLLGGPGNLLGLISFGVFAVVGWRRSALPLWAAVLCGVGGLVAIVLAEFGTSVLIGSFWLYMAASRLDGSQST